MVPWLLEIQMAADCWEVTQALPDRPPLPKYQHDAATVRVRGEHTAGRLNERKIISKARGL